MNTRRVDLLHAADRWEGAIDRLENATELDRVATRLQQAIVNAVGDGLAHEVLIGTWLGHAAHPMLTDLPIGFWTSAFVLDLIGGRQSRGAAELLVGLGVLSALPTVATGAADWSRTGPRARRVGVVHALANTSAIGLYAWSWRARRQNHYVAGVTLGMLGATTATIGGLLGGHLLSRLGVGAGSLRAFPR